LLGEGGEKYFWRRGKYSNSIGSWRGCYRRGGRSRDAADRDEVLEREKARSGKKREGLRATKARAEQYNHPGRQKRGSGVEKIGQESKKKKPGYKKKKKNHSTDCASRIDRKRREMLLYRKKKRGDEVKKSRCRAARTGMTLDVI